MRSVLATVMATSLAVGCGPQSKLSPTASVKLTGTVQTQSGAPVAGTKVTLVRHPDALEAIGDLFAIAGTVGLACIAGQLDICNAFATATTDSHGQFSFALKGADTQGATDDAVTFTTFAACGASDGNCGMSSDFIVQKTALTIPALKEWTTLGSVANASSGDAVFTWPSLPSTVGGGAAGDARVVIHDTNGNTVWIADAKTAQTVTVDRHATQDFAGSWLVQAQRSDSNAGTHFADGWYSPPQTYTSRFLNPISRTSDCIIQSKAGPIDLPRPCALTDGNMGTKLMPDATLGSYNWIAIDIGFAHPLALLVLYDVAITGSSQKLAIETTSDLMTWTTLTTVSATPYQVVPLATTTQYIRLRVVDSDGAFTTGNSELAIYAPDGT